MTSRMLRRITAELGVLCILALPAVASGPDGVPVLANPGNSSISRVMRVPSVPAAMWVFVEDDRDDEGDLYRAAFSTASYSADILPLPGQPVVVRPGLQYGAVAAPVGTVNCPLQGGCAPMVVAYHEEISGTHVLRVTRIGDGDSWDVQVVADGQSPAGLEVVPDGSAGAWICWLSNTTGELRYQHVDGNGALLLTAAGEVLTPVGEQGSGLQVASDGAGGFFASWLASSLAGGNLGIRAQRIAASGGAFPGWPAYGVVVRTIAAGSIGDPLMAPSPGLGVYIVWSESTGPGPELTTETRIVRIQPDATVWPAFAGSVPYLTDRSEQDVQAIASDGQGGVVVAVLCNFDGVGQYVVQRMGPDGARPSGWPAEGVKASTPPLGTQQHGGRIIGVSGGLYVVWQEDVPGAEGGDIVATHRLADATLPTGWLPEGNVVGGGAVHQYDPFIVNDESDGALIVWGQDVASSTFGTEVYGNTVNAGGQLDVPPPLPRPTQVSLTLGSRNPSSSGFRFTLALPEAADVRADVVDVAGRRVAELMSGPMPAGRQSLTWPGTHTPGLYFVRARVAGRSLSIPVTIAR